LPTNFTTIRCKIVFFYMILYNTGTVQLKNP
jgi:hypothetical protein